jgi:hypothetical protein
MTRIMANWDAEADITLPHDTPFMRYEHPQGKYLIFLRKAPPEQNNPLKLSLQLLCDAPSLAEAHDISESHAKEFLDYLSYTSNLRTRLGKPQHIFDWEPSTKEHGIRDALYYHTSPTDEPPFAEIHPNLLETIALLQRNDLDVRLRRCLKWFSNGIAAQYQDDQFTFFWFVVELVAQIAKDVTPVPDRCPKCREPMFCPSCNATHLHRPYPKHAVEALFQKMVKGDWQTFHGRAYRARNMLLHGDELVNIEKELGIEFPRLIDDVGKLAWTAILNRFAPSLVGTRPAFYQASTYGRSNVIFAASIQVGYTPDFENPDPTKLPDVKISMEFVDMPPRAPQPQTGDGA